MRKTTATSHHLRPSWNGLTEAAQNRSCRVLFIVVSMAVTFTYSLLLPFKYTQHIAFGNWNYLDIRLLAFSIAYGLAFATVITLQVYTFSKFTRVGRKSGATTTLSTAASLLSCLACCSPLIPSVLGILGLSGIALLTTSIPIERFLAKNQNILLSGGLVLLIFSAVWSAKRVALASCTLVTGRSNSQEKEVLGKW